MSYTTAQLARISGANSGAGALWQYKSTDPIATVLVADYFSDGDARALKVDDLIHVVDSNLNEQALVMVSSVTSAGAASVVNAAVNASGVVAGSAATLTITAAQSGKTFLFDSAAGQVFTLPPASVGLKYNFMTTVDLTAAAYAVLCSTASPGDFFVGSANVAVETEATGEMFFGNGTSHLGISSNKTTTGGLIGGHYEIECLTATKWSIKAVLSATATPATPFTT